MWDFGLCPPDQPQYTRVNVPGAGAGGITRAFEDFVFLSKDRLQTSANGPLVSGNGSEKYARVWVGWREI